MEFLTLLQNFVVMFVTQLDRTHARCRRSRGRRLDPPRIRSLAEMFNLTQQS